MSTELSYLAEQVAKGRMSRREFVGRASALGVSAAIASSMLGDAAWAAGTPVRGGQLRAGMGGGESTNTLDPALALSNVPFVVNETWGEKLVEVNGDGSLNMRIAEEVSSSKDAVTWKFKIRNGVKFHNGKDVTAEDVVATLKRHTDKASKSGALGIVKGIADMKAEGDMVTLTLSGGNADLPYLMADYHLIIQPGGGVDNPAAGIGAGAYKIKNFEPGVRVDDGAFRRLLGRVARPCRRGRGPGDQRWHRTDRGAAIGPGRHDQPGGPQDRGASEEHPRRDHRDRRGPGALRLHHGDRQAALRQQRPAHGAEAGGEPRGDGAEDPRRLRHARQRLPDQLGLSAVRQDDSAAHLRSGQGGGILQEIRP